MGDLTWKPRALARAGIAGPGVGRLSSTLKQTRSRKKTSASGPVAEAIILLLVLLRVVVSIVVNVRDHHFHLEGSEMRVIWQFLLHPKTRRAISLKFPYWRRVRLQRGRTFVYKTLSSSVPERTAVQAAPPVACTLSMPTATIPTSTENACERPQASTAQEKLAAHAHTTCSQTRTIRGT